MYGLSDCFKIAWIVDVYDDAMITCQFRLCIICTVYLYMFQPFLFFMQSVGSPLYVVSSRQTHRIFLG